MAALGGMWRQPPKVDPLEIARGALCVASYESINVSREVHITKLLGHFDRAGIAGTAALKTLWFLREAESLDEGYWIPAPTRSVHLGDELCLVVGIQTTDELRRHFPSVRRAGSARVADASEVSSLPTQSLASWRGFDGLDSARWAQSVIESSSDTFAPSLGADELEVFGIRPYGGSIDGRDPVWVRPGEGNVCTWRGVSLFRARTGQAKHRHFLGRYKGKSAFLEGPPVHEVSRMQFGLSALQGQTLRSIRATTNGIDSIRLPLSPPTALRRMLVALCDEDHRSFGRTWFCRTAACMPPLLEALKDISGEALQHE